MYCCLPIEKFIGEALNLDLEEFIAELYTLMIPLSQTVNIEDKITNQARLPNSHLLLRCVDLATKSTFGTDVNRILTFCKRLLLCALHWPPDTALRAVRFVRSKRQIDCMLTTDDRNVNGQWNGLVDNWSVANVRSTVFYEIFLLQRHFDDAIRVDTKQLLRRGDV